KLLVALLPSGVAASTVIRYSPRIGNRYFHSAFPCLSGNCICTKEDPSTAGKSVERYHLRLGASARIVTHPCSIAIPSDFATLTARDAGSENSRSHHNGRANWNRSSNNLI